MRLSDYIGAFFITAFVLIGLSGVFVHMASEDKYNVTIGETFDGVYTNVTELESLVSDTTGIGVDMKEGLETAKDLPDDYTDPKKQRIKVLFFVDDGFDMVKNMFIETGRILHIPPIIVAVIIGLLIFSIAFAIITLIFGRKG